jgi:hypothetical protein
VNEEAKRALAAAARAAQKILELRTAELGFWHNARDTGLSYTAISRGLTLEMARLGMTPDEIDRTGTGPDNIRKRLSA